ncbi:hypothetical protein [Rhodanobacter koreensis]
MPNTDKQFERDVFDEFIRIAGLSVLPASIEQLEPPFPDVVCNVSGIRKGFELSLITDPVIEEKVRRGRSGFTHFKLDPVTALRKKLSKTYAQGLRIDLVLHEGAAPISSLPWGWRQEFRVILNNCDQAVFQRVWVIGLCDSLVLACFYRRAGKYVLRREAKN